jgi:hypothetical protein
VSEPKWLSWLAILMMYTSKGMTAGKIFRSCDKTDHAGAPGSERRHHLVGKLAHGHEGSLQLVAGAQCMHRCSFGLVPSVFQLQSSSSLSVYNPDNPGEISAENANISFSQNNPGTVSTQHPHLLTQQK